MNLKVMIDNQANIHSVKTLDVSVDDDEWNDMTTEERDVFIRTEFVMPEIQYWYEEI